MWYYIAFSLILGHFAAYFGQYLLYLISFHLSRCLAQSQFMNIF